MFFPHSLSAHVHCIISAGATKPEVSSPTGISGHSTSIVEERGKGIGTLHVTYNVIDPETVDGTSTTPSKDINQSVQQQTIDSQSSLCEGIIHTLCTLLY